MFGLTKKDPPARPLIEMTAQEFAQLTQPQALLLTRLVDQNEERKLEYARQALWCSSLCFAICVICFTVLVMYGHPRFASVLLGTTVLGFLGRFIKARL